MYHQTNVSADQFLTTDHHPLLITTPTMPPLPFCQLREESIVDLITKEDLTAMPLSPARQPPK